MQDTTYMDALIQKADKMLYKAKKEGKNRVFSYDWAVKHNSAGSSAANGGSQ